MLKKLKLSSEGGDSDSKKCKRGCGCAYGGVWRSLGLARDSSQAGGFFFFGGAFGRNLTSMIVKMCSHLTNYTKKFYKFCTFNAIRKYNAAKHCITVQHKKCSFPLTLTAYSYTFN
jgi:hypothetical protein